MSRQHKSVDITTSQSQLEALRQSLRLEQIAYEHLGVQTLSQRGEMHLDFHDLHVTQIRSALESAFEAGRHAANNQ